MYVCMYVFVNILTKLSLCAGLGCFMYEDGARYEGQLEEGLPNGWGLLREFSRHFLGRFRGGLPHGFGVLQVGGAWGEWGGGDVTW